MTIKIFLFFSDFAQKDEELNNGKGYNNSNHILLDMGENLEDYIIQFDDIMYKYKLCQDKAVKLLIELKR